MWAKGKVKKGTESTEKEETSSKTTMLGNVLQKVKKQEIPVGVSKFTTDLNRALLGKHFKQLYDNLKHPESYGASSATDVNGKIEWTSPQDWSSRDGPVC